jgi:putative hydrolase of the HAD superfamily
MIKPDVCIYQYLLDKYQLLPEECFFIDDMARNVAGAEKAGIRGTVFDGDFEEIRNHPLLQSVMTSRL